MAGLHLLVAPWLAVMPLSTPGEPMPSTIKISVQVGCEIRTTKNADGTRLDAVISATGAVAGTYAFKVEPRGGGEPLIDERADFEIESDTPSEVKKAGLDLPAGEGYNASLSIEWPNGSSSCGTSAS